jgi:hypothetical protein
MTATAFVCACSGAREVAFAAFDSASSRFFVQKNTSKLTEA